MQNKPQHSVADNSGTLLLTGLRLTRSNMSIRCFSSDSSNAFSLKQNNDKTTKSVIHKISDAPNQKQCDEMAMLLTLYNPCLSVLPCFCLLFSFFKWSTICPSSISKVYSMLPACPTHLSDRTLRLI